MPKVKNSAKTHTSTISDQEVDLPSSYEDSTNSDHDSENKISFHPSRPQATHPVLQSMFMPYIEGPKMDWTVNDSWVPSILEMEIKVQKHTQV